MKELKIAPPALSRPTYKYVAPTPHIICDNNTLMDPYESQRVKIVDSGYAGDTVYARRDIAKGQIVAYYIGTIYLTSTYRNLTGQDE